MGRERNENGRYTEQVTKEKVIEAFKARGAKEDEAVIMSAKEVADYIGCTRQAADKKLRKLEDTNEVAKQKVGNRSVIWVWPARRLRR